MAIVRVQAPTPTVVPTVTSSTITFGSNVTAGNLLIVAARAASITNGSISDNLAGSGAWKSLSGVWGNSQDKVIWAKMCTATGAMTVTVTGASGTIRIAAVEYSGANILDLTYIGLGPSPSTNINASAFSISSLPLEVGSLVVAGISGAANSTITAGGGAPNSDFVTFTNASGYFALEDNVNWPGDVASPAFNLSVADAPNIFVLGKMVIPSFIPSLGRRPVPMINGPSTDRIIHMSRAGEPG